MSGFPSFRLAALRAAPALLLAGVSSHALAEMPAALSYTSSDRGVAALLGGGMSRLSQISAQQAGAMTTSWMPPPVASDTVVNNRRIAAFIGTLPGSELEGVRISLASTSFNYRAPELVPSFMRDVLPASTPPPIAFVLPARPVSTLSSTPPRNGQPDVFGSVALPISRTALDGKWAAAARPIVDNGLWSGLVHAARRTSGQQQVEMINRWVNQRLRFVDDRGDNWTSASQSLLRGAGDCEDYAIAKMKLLEASGFDRRAMFLVIARDLVRQADHAILAVRIDDRLMILDNMTDRVLPSSDVSDYRPIMSFNAYGRWTHGYRVTTPPKVQFAAR